MNYSTLVQYSFLTLVFFGVLVGVFFVGDREGRADHKESHTFIQEYGCVLGPGGETQDTAGQQIQSCDNYDDNVSNLEEAIGRYEELLGQEGQEFGVEQTARNARSREATGLCTLKTSLNADEVQELLPNESKVASLTGDVNNTTLQGAFEISTAETNASNKDHPFPSGTSEARKREIKDSFNLLCTYSSVKLVQRWLFFGAGAVTILFMVIGGLLWITAGDSDDKAKKARGFLLSAIVGFVIVLLSTTLLSIVRFVV